MQVHLHPMYVCAVRVCVHVVCGVLCARAAATLCPCASLREVGGDEGRGRGRARGGVEGPPWVGRVHTRRPHYGNGLGGGRARGEHRVVDHGTVGSVVQECRGVNKVVLEVA